MGLSVSRRKGESILIGDDVTVTVTHIQSGKVKLTIAAPSSVVVDRGEIRASKMLERKAVPNPGSDAALKLGCTCPVMDNHHGRGDSCSFWISADCPLHGIKAARKPGRRQHEGSKR